MRANPRRWQRWQFVLAVIAPAVILLVLTASAVAAFVFWAAQDIDERSLERQNRLAGVALDRQIDAIPFAQESVAIWDDTIENAKFALNEDWLDNNLGTWMYDYYGFDAVAVLSESGEPIYTTAGGVSPAPEFFAAERSTIAPMVEELRRDIAGGALAAYEDGTRAQFPRVLDITTIAGRTAVVSILPIVSETGRIFQEQGTEYFHLAIDYLDQNFADTLHRNYLFDGARFTSSPLAGDEHVGRPVLDRAGRVAAMFEWIPSRPGAQLVSQAAPVLGLGFLVASLVVLLLLWSLWTSRAALEAQRSAAQHDALHDPLTGLPNRTQFEQGLGIALKHAARRHQDVALMILDLDHFKQINDTLGHNAGDDLIRAVGQRLAELVGEEAALSRLGGDEFAIVHRRRPGGVDARGLAERIVEAMTTPFEVAGSEAFVSASVGLTLAAASEQDRRELIRKADIALYEAKASGRGRVAVYADAMDEMLQDRHKVEAELRNALKSGTQLDVVFQPLYLGRTGDIAGAEALVRWAHPKLGQVSPARFIPIAEGAGLIEPLGEFVLRRAMTFGARWPGRRVAVNISPVQLRNPRFPERLLDMLIDTGMRPSDLELEITEGILLDSQSVAVETLVTLRRAGIRIALDDFGTGYSSLNYLKRYPVDSIKIDRSFVAQLGASSTSAAIVHAMVTLAHALGIEVTAEGVETHDQLTILKGMGCNLFQGFLLSPPASEQDVESKYRLAIERREKQSA